MIKHRKSQKQEAYPASATHVGTSDGGPDVESRQGIGKDGVEAKGLDDVGIHVMAEMDRPLVGSNGRRVLDAISAIHPRRADVVDPSHTKLDEALRFHELLGHEGVAGVALKDLSREPLGDRVRKCRPRGSRFDSFGDMACRDSLV